MMRATPLLRRRLAILVTILAIVTLACGNAAPSPEEEAPLKTMVAATLTALPSATAIPPTQAAPTATVTPPPPTASPPPTTAAAVGYKAYDFIDHLCDASWTNSLEPIPCPGKDQATLGLGWVYAVDNPVLEGVHNYQRGMLTHPATNTSIGQSQIFGTYPPFPVLAGDQFRATVGCLSNWESLYGWPATGCSVQFALEYYDANGIYHSQTLPWSNWEETYDGAVTTINVDLSPLAGQTVRFTLTVRDQGNPQGDYALWVEPQIWRIAPP